MAHKQGNGTHSKQGYAAPMEAGQATTSPESAPLEAGAAVRRASGLYAAKVLTSRPVPGLPVGEKDPEGAIFDMLDALETQEEEAGAAVAPLVEQLRLDLDGVDPQYTVSGELMGLGRPTTTWIAKVKPVKGRPGTWVGPIWYRHGDTRAFAFTQVAVRIVAPGRALAALTGPGGISRVLGLVRKSLFFRKVEFEFDVVEGATPWTSVDTHAHPDHPADLGQEVLDIGRVFQRTGFDVRISSAGSIVPLTGAKADQLWSDSELHDAMKVYWSRFRDRAQWAMWLLFAARHQQGESLGGIMFDDIGPNHRQGAALFTDSFIAEPPGGDTAPQAWVRRSIFYTAVHEMGHAFNLAHSWQKALGTPWIPLANEPQARSFMNYPSILGEQSFYQTFRYRFSDSELLFLRHAPSRFVQPGNADWFDHHGFEAGLAAIHPRLRLELRRNGRDRPVAFMEPLMLEAKLTNTGPSPMVVPGRILSEENLTIVVKREGQAARERLPIARRCAAVGDVVLNPGESLYEPLFVGADRSGWLVAEAGNYLIQAALAQDERAVVSNPLALRVEAPKTPEASVLAQDFFTEDVGRVMTFDGSRAPVLEHANDALRRLVELQPESDAAIHARVALAMPDLSSHKVLDMKDGEGALRSAAELDAHVRTRAADPSAAKDLLEEVLTRDLDRAADTLGNIDARYYAERYTGAMTEVGETREALVVQDTLAEVMRRRGVLPEVVEHIEERAEDYEELLPKAATRRQPEARA